MSTIDSDNLEAPGYFLPEDSWLRLKQLRDYVGFLANLARPRRPDEDQEWAAEIRTGEVSICLELLEEQIGRVLDELSWPAERGETAVAPETAADTEVEAEAADTDAVEPDAAEPAMGQAGKRWLSGVSLSQIDEFHLLIDSLRAHGNVVTCADHAELKDVTLSIMGDAICRDAERLREIVDDIYDDQRLRPPLGTKPGVREEQAAYHALPAPLLSGSAPPAARSLPIYH